MILDCRNIPVQELLPHSPPMVLIDRVVSYDDISLIAEVTITAGSKFFDPNRQSVPAWVGIEYMAQSISALAGIRSKQNGTEVKIGFLLGTRKYLIKEKSFALGKVLQVQVNQLFRDESGLASFDCQIKDDKLLMVESRINVYEVNDINSFNKL